MNTQAYSTWLEIDLDAIKNNIQQIKKMTQTAVMAVIKANGYGHGVLEVARAAAQAGASWCGVARMEEALNLRAAGLTTEIMVLGFTPPKLIPEAIKHQIHVAFYDLELARAYVAQASRTKGKLQAHLKVETGMGRLGMAVDQVPGFLADMHDHDQIDVTGIFTHFARADEPESGATEQQLSIFKKLLEELETQSLLPGVVHAANSAAVMNFPQAYFDLVRPGIAIFGLDPSPQTSLPKGFWPALTWKARLTSVRTFPPGHGISYGSAYVTSKEERIGVIPVGYGDGYRRLSGQQVLCQGQRVNVVGRVCMDQCMLQLDSVLGASIGDEVVLLGKQGDQRITAAELAQLWGTLNYEVVCGLADRLPRVYNKR
jgi:alanine racemase